jgi:hypothetical protein
VQHGRHQIHIPTPTRFFHPFFLKSFDIQLLFLNKETKNGLKLETKKNQNNDFMVL